VGLFRDVCHVPGNLLNDGMYRVMLHVVRDQGTHVYQEDDILVFEVRDTPDMRSGWFGKWGGVVRPILDWDRELVQSDESHVTDATELNLKR